MWKLCLVSFIAVCLLPDTTLSQGFCSLCNPSCNVRIGGDERRLNFFNNSLYYFETDQKKYTWKEGEAACTDLFSFPKYPGRPGNLASFQTKEEYDFILSKLKDSSSLFPSVIGGKRSEDDFDKWIWTDGTPMNKSLIEDEKTKLWTAGEPNNFQQRGEKIMAIWKNLYNVNGLVDLRDYISYGSFVCRIPCSTPTISPLIGRPECKNYKSLTDIRRKAQYSPKGPWPCDRTNTYSFITNKYSYGRPSTDWEGENWYRFEGAAGDKMLMSAPKRRKCGTNVGIWLNSPLPKIVGESLEARYCEAEDQDKEKCIGNVLGKVTKCDNYYVYYLPNTKQCSRRYCGTNEPEP